MMTSSIKDRQIISVRFDASDGLELCGQFWHVPDSTVAVIHVHGKCGNFYQNEFVGKMGEAYSSSGISFLSFNTRGHDCIAEGYRNNQLVYVGGSLERIEESAWDIEGACAFLRKKIGNAAIVLQGHSYGCDKAVLAAELGIIAEDMPLILISPADSWEIQKRYIAPETIEQLATRLRTATCKSALARRADYGVKTKEIEYSIPISIGALEHLINGDGLKKLSPSHIEKQSILRNPALVLLGGLDPIQIISVHNYKDYFETRFDNSQVEIFPNADHHFSGQNDAMIKAVLTYLLSWTAGE